MNTYFSLCQPVAAEKKSKSAPVAAAVAKRYIIIVHGLNELGLLSPSIPRNQAVIFDWVYLLEREKRSQHERHFGSYGKGGRQTQSAKSSFSSLFLCSRLYPHFLNPSHSDNVQYILTCARSFSPWQRAVQLKTGTHTAAQSSFLIIPSNQAKIIMFVLSVVTLLSQNKLEITNSALKEAVDTFNPILTENEC